MKPNCWRLQSPWFCRFALVLTTAMLAALARILRLLARTLLTALLATLMRLSALGLSAMELCQRTGISPPSSHGCGRTASDEELVQPDWVTQTANSRATRSGFRQKGDHRTVSLEALLETLLEIRRSRTSIAAAATGAGVDLEGLQYKSIGCSR